MYLSSQTFSMFIRIIVVINFVGLFLTDYNFRLQQAQGEQPYTNLQNALSLNLQVFTNCVFTIEIILQFFSFKVQFKNPWNVLNIVGTVACWDSIFFDMFQNDKSRLFEILHIQRILRGLRIIQVFLNSKNLFQVFLGTAPSLAKILFPLIVFMSFYAITGQHLFLGSNQHKCRLTYFPMQNGTWPQASWDLCGSDAFKCPAGTTCGNPYDFGLPQDSTQQKQRSQQRGLVGFNNFFKAMLTVYHYVFLSNWSGIIFKFSKFINPYLTTFYFVSMAVVLLFILANLIFISLSKPYLQKQKLLQKKKQNSFNISNTGQAQNYQALISKQQQKISQNAIYVLKIIQVFQVVLIVIQSIVLVINYKYMSYQFVKYLSLFNFITIIIAIAVILARFYILKFKMMKRFENMVDLVLLICFVAEIVYCFIKGKSIIYYQKGFSALIRSFKIIRLIKVLYISIYMLFLFHKLYYLQLDILICQSIIQLDSTVPCYRFYDVITKFSKIKLQVSLDKGNQNTYSIQLDIHHIIQNQARDFIVKIPQDLYKNYTKFKNYTSGEMKYLFGFLRKLRSWKSHSKSKGEIKVSKLSRIINVASRVRQFVIIVFKDQNNILIFTLSKKPFQMNKINLLQNHSSSYQQCRKKFNNKIYRILLSFVQEIKNNQLRRGKNNQVDPIAIQTDNNTRTTCLISHKMSPNDDQLIHSNKRLALQKQADFKINQTISNEILVQTQKLEIIYK